MIRHENISIITIKFILYIVDPATNDLYEKEIEFSDNNFKYNMLIPRIDEKIFINGTLEIVKDVVYHYHHEFRPYIIVKAEITEPFEKYKQIIEINNYNKKEN